MAVNLTALVQHLHELSNGGERDPSGLRTDRAYQDALQAYWRGDHDGAATKIADHLADDPDGAHRFASYRLWIECCAETSDRASLRVLRDHLFLRGQAEPDDLPRYAALRGLAHLELDQASAAKLLAKGLRDEVADPYALELCQIVDNRFGVGDGIPVLCRATTRIDDFFHWQTLARGLIATGDDEAMSEVLQHVRTTYRGSPMPLLFEFHRCVESGYYAGAAVCAARLTEMFPNNRDYAYYHAYALFEDGDYPGARRILSDVVRTTGEDDAEIVGLLGHCHAKLGEPEKAAQYLRTAVSLLKAEGLPSSHVNIELANVEEEMRGDKLDPALEMPRATRMWLINLSPRRYHELQTSSETHIDRLLRPMGAEPRPGDYCFFAAPDAPEGDGSARWKIVAIYAVDSEPMWHPVHRYHTALRLVNRPPEGIPVDVAPAADEGRATELDRDNPYAYGVYELEVGALDIITEAVRRHNDGERERRRGGNQARRPAG
jgi:tetratricopeptide (TPR) repeat protein